MLRLWVERTLAWKIWERLLETNFVDRSVALAGKAFVSFFPLVIVVAAFLPERLRKSIVSTLVHRLGLAGHSLATVQGAFSSASDIRRATGVLGLILTIFFATSFTTALQRMYLAAWRRPSPGPVGAYTRGAEWILAIIVYMAVLGGVRKILPGPVGDAFFVLVALALSASFWWFTAWLMMLGQVRHARADSVGSDHGPADRSLRVVGHHLDAAQCVEQQQPIRVLRDRHLIGLVVLGRGDLHHDRCVRRAGAGRGHGRSRSNRRFGADSLLVEGAPAFMPPPLHGPQLADAFKERDETAGT